MFFSVVLLYGQENVKQSNTYFPSEEQLNTGMQDVTFPARASKAVVVCNEQDSLALVALYNVTNGDEWTDNSGWLIDSVYKWNGITLDDNGRVTVIDLSENNLVGTIPADIGDLSNLQTLYLNKNELTGSIPSELTNLSELVNLDLSGNELTGTIPAGIGSMSNLVVLNLSSNSFTGDIPPELGNLSNLQYLMLGYNNLSGSIPSQFGNLSSLRYLYLKKSGLNGAIPSELGTLTNLGYINVSSNNIDSIYANLSNVGTLYLDKNRFDFGDLEATNKLGGQIQSYAPQANVPVYVDEIGGGQYKIYVHKNGTNTVYQWYNVDTPISGASDTVITVSSNGAYICIMTNPDYPDLTLYSDAYEVGTGVLKNGVLAKDYDALAALYNSTDGDNWTDKTNWMSTEPVSDWKGVVISGMRIVELDVSENNLTGTVPAQLGNLDSLTLLMMYRNNLSGDLPSELANLKKIKTFTLSSNNFSGSFPSVLTQMPSLEYLSIGDNNFSGEIPAEMTGMSNLTYFYAYKNRFDQLPAFPDNMFRSLGINNNKFDFGDLEPIMNCATYFTYAPQLNVGDTVINYFTVGSNYSFSVNVDGSKNHYQWYKDEVPIDGATLSTMEITDAQIADIGSYYCEITSDSITDLTLYSNPFILKEGEATGIEQSAIVSVFPNPAKSFLNITGAKGTKFEIYNLQGSLVKRGVINSTAAQIEISGLNAGVYLMKLTSKGSTNLHKFVKK